MGEQQAVRDVRRIAMIVVAGVGEQSESTTSLHGNLIKWVDAYEPDENSPGSVDFAVTPVSDDEWGPDERTLEDVATATLRRTRSGKDPDQVDVFEMRWSDLSRFPSGLPGFIATLFGLAVQVGTIGLEAIAGIVRRSDTKPRKLILGTMEFASWVGAALVIPVTTAMVVAAVNLWLVLDVPAGLPDWLMPPVVGALGALGVWFVAKALDDGGWVYGGRRWESRGQSGETRPSAPTERGQARRSRWNPIRWVLAMWEARGSPILWGVVIYVGTCALWVWSYWEERSIRIASAETLLYGSGYGLRAVWLFALGVLAFALVALLVWAAGRLAKAPRSGSDVLHDEGFLGRWVSGVTTMVISPFAVALVGTLLFAGVAGVAFESAENARWGSEAPKIRCFAHASSWEATTDCGSKPREWPATARTIAKLDAEADDLTDAARAASPVRAVELRNDATAARVAANTTEADADATPVDWGTALFVIITIPVTDAMLALGFLLVVGGVLFLIAVLVYWKKRGAALAKALRTFWHPLASLALALIGLGGIAVAWCVWLGGLPSWLSFLTGDPWDSNRAEVLTAAGLATTGLLLISRFVPIDLRGFRGAVGKLEFGGDELGGNLEALRKRLDPAYDIASYLRLYRSKTGTRPTIIARYRALLREIARRDYEALLIVAHSQGAVLTAATLFGDPYRRAPEAENNEDHGVRGWTELKDPPDLPKNIVLLTCGCPLRQSYESLMPGDYSWLWEKHDLRPLTRAWINVYWPRDYIGQAMFRAPLTPESRVQGSVFEATRVGDVARLDVCLKGKGGHVGYWTDGEFAKWVDYAVTRCLGDPDPGYPDGYRFAREGAIAAPDASAAFQV
jgi:hypothetical protein